MNRRRWYLSVAITCAALLACQEPAFGPLPLPITMSPVAQYAGEVVTLHSPEFLNLTLIPLADLELEYDTLPRPNRWQNLIILVGGDTAQSWRVGPAEIAVRVPPLVTGNYDLEVRLDGHERFTVPLYVAGLAGPPGQTTHAYTNAFTVFPASPRLGLLAENVGWPGFPAGLRVYDLHSGASWTVPTSQPDSGEDVRMDVPGPSYRPGAFLFDASPTNGPPRVRVWDYASLVSVDSLPCPAPITSYQTAAEPSAGVCLLVSSNGEVFRNDVSILPPDLSRFDAAFRMAAGGQRTALVTRRAFDPASQSGPPVPVFDASGTVLFSMSGFVDVPGADFSPDGDTLYVVASVVDTAGGRDWLLAVFDASTGVMRSSVPFPDESALQDVLLDPVRPVLYVGSVRDEAAVDLSGEFLIPFQRQHVTIVDRATLTPLASIAARGSPLNYAFGRPSPVGRLVYGGHSDRLFVFSWCGFDCGGPHAFAFDLTLP